MNTVLQEWISEQLVRDEMLWKGAYASQMMFLRDRVQFLIGAGLPFGESANLARVISTHRSKSIDLPVVRLDRPDLGISFVMRDNFYDWKLTVLSTRPIDADLAGLFFTEPPSEPEYTGDELHSVYFEGFPPELIRGYWTQNKCQWSASIGGDHAFWATLFLCMRSIGALPDRRYHTRESHRRELAEARTA